MQRTALVLALALVLSLGFAVPAGADPVRNPNAQQYSANCGGEQWDVIVKDGVPAHIIGSTGMVIAHSFSFVWTVTPEEGDPFVFEEVHTIGQGEKRGLQDRLVTCTVPIQIVEPGFGTLEGILTVEAFFTPQGPRRN